MKNLQVDIVLEILGRPKDYIKTALEQLIERLSKEKGVKIISQKIHEAKEIENKKDLFTSFAEVSLELDSLSSFFGILFAYMPANVELISPEKIELSNAELNELGNKLIARLHDYDAITKKIIVERNIALNELKKYAPHLFKKPSLEEEINKETQKNEAKNQQPEKKSKTKKD
ncbi:MAG: hypothetical protein N3D20_00200 [Candidatus Pacearchaeota archaeon]|nr:hypothetical protein [Candidatus Pacearchaeota archaeon]